MAVEYWEATKDLQKQYEKVKFNKFPTSHIVLRTGIGNYSKIHLRHYCINS